MGLSDPAEQDSVVHVTQSYCGVRLQIIKKKKVKTQSNKSLHETTLNRSDFKQNSDKHPVHMATGGFQARDEPFFARTQRPSKSEPGDARQRQTLLGLARTECKVVK